MPLHVFIGPLVASALDRWSAGAGRAARRPLHAELSHPPVAAAQLVLRVVEDLELRRTVGVATNCANLLDALPWERGEVTLWRCGLGCTCPWTPTQADTFFRDLAVGVQQPSSLLRTSGLWPG